jgi:hypothetical protein
VHLLLVSSGKRRGVMDDSSSTILLYVDDLMIFSDTDELRMSTINHLKKVYKEVSFDIGCKHSYLGMTFTFDSGSPSLFHCRR